MCNMGACCAALGFDGVAGLHLCNALPGLPEAGERPEDGERFAAACHNLGLVALRQGRYESAFQYLARALPYFGMRSRIWLRLAECCVGAHREEQLQLERETPLAAALPDPATDEAEPDAFSRYRRRADVQRSRGRSVETSRAAAAAATWIVHRDESWRRRGCDVDSL